MPTQDSPDPGSEPDAPLESIQLVEPESSGFGMVRAGLIVVALVVLWHFVASTRESDPTAEAPAEAAAEADAAVAAAVAAKAAEEAAQAARKMDAFEEGVARAAKQRTIAKVGLQKRELNGVSYVLDLPSGWRTERGSRDVWFREIGGERYCQATSNPVFDLGVFVAEVGGDEAGYESAFADYLLSARGTPKTKGKLLSRDQGEKSYRYAVRLNTSWGRGDASSDSLMVVATAVRGKHSIRLQCSTKGRPIDRALVMEAIARSLDVWH